MFINKKYKHNYISMISKEYVYYDVYKCKLHYLFKYITFVNCCLHVNRSLNYKQV